MVVRFLEPEPPGHQPRPRRKDVGWRLGRNYQLFRYMLASNVNGREPTLFNGGLFTFDPLYVNGKKGPGYTPDHRQWGAAFTAQNQRLVYLAAAERPAISICCRRGSVSI